LLIGRGKAYDPANPLRDDHTSVFTKAGITARELMIASDTPALLPHAQQVCYLEDGHIVDLSDAGVAISTFAGVAVEPTFKNIEVTAEAVSKGTFDSFMAKEIAEQPSVLSRLLDSRLRGGANGSELVEPDLGLDLKAVNHVRAFMSKWISPANIAIAIRWRLAALWWWRSASLAKLPTPWRDCV
jgi:hypothetical protein